MIRASFIAWIVLSIGTVGYAQSGAIGQALGVSASEADPVPGPDADRAVRLIDDIQENMRQIEELLAEQKTCSRTQELQRSTLTKIDDLIQALEKQCRNPKSSCNKSGSGGGGGGSRSPQRGVEDDSLANGGQTGSPPGESGSEEQSAPESSGPDSKQEELAQSSAGEEPKDDSGASDVDGGTGRENNRHNGRNGPGKEGELIVRKGYGRWGRLPRRDVEQMYESGRRKLPTRYRVLLEEYFRRLPE